MRINTSFALAFLIRFANFVHTKNLFLIFISTIFNKYFFQKKSSVAAELFLFMKESISVILQIYWASSNLS